MQGVKLLEAWYDQVWVKGNIEAIDMFMDPGVEAEGLMSDFAAEMEDFKSLIPAVRKQVRDISVTLEDSMEMENRLWARVRIEAKKAADMAPVSITGQVMIMMENGIIKRAYNTFDLISYFEQMGNLPKDTIALCLAGEELR